MATLQERIEADYKTALKAGERRRVDTVRLIKAELQKATIEKRVEQLPDADVIQVVSRQVKQRQETLEAAIKANRQDMVAQTNEELAILKVYLPQALSTEALKQLIDEAIKTVGANQGQIMKAVMAKAAGAADGKLVSQLVTERLKQTAKA